MRVRQFSDLHPTVEDVLHAYYPVNGIVLKLRELSTGRVGYAKALFGQGFPEVRGPITEWHGDGGLNPTTHEVLESYNVSGGFQYTLNTIEYDETTGRHVRVHANPAPHYLR